MANPAFPGFDDAPETNAPKPAAPAAPPPLQAYAFDEDPAPAAPAGPRRPMVAPVAAPPAAAPVAVAVPVSPAPVSPTPGAAKPQPTKPAGVMPPAPAQAEAADEDADLKPGSRKDLWPCPHCQTRNKPGRTTCRSCGKAPTDPVAAPWFLRPVTWIAGVAVVGAVIGAVVLLKPDLSFHPADAAHVDKAVRLNHDRGPERSVDGRTFDPRGRLSVVGRVVSLRPVPDVSHATTVVLALGSAAKDDAWQGVTVTYNGTRVEVSGGKAAVLHLIQTAPVAWPLGTWVSITGEHGILAEGITKYPALDDGLTVVPERVQP